jgi:hypothetical protein
MSAMAPPLCGRPCSSRCDRAESCLAERARRIILCERGWNAASAGLPPGVAKAMTRAWGRSPRLPPRPALATTPIEAGDAALPSRLPTSPEHLAALPFHSRRAILSRHPPTRLNRRPPTVRTTAEPGAPRTEVVRLAAEPGATPHQSVPRAAEPGADPSTPPKWFDLLQRQARAATKVVRLAAEARATRPELMVGRPHGCRGREASAAARWSRARQLSAPTRYWRLQGPGAQPEMLSLSRLGRADDAALRHRRALFVFSIASQRLGRALLRVRTGVPGRHQARIRSEHVPRANAAR